jgi:Spy/CpxP family protein refolding chaperone
MLRKMTVWSRLVVLLLIFAFLAPGLAQSQGAGAGNYLGQREQLLRELNLSPDKAKAFMSVGAHWEQIRQKIIAGIKENETGLESALGAPPPDDNKITHLVNALIAAHDQLFDTFKSQRQEEMNLLTPVQRGKFLLALKKWHEEQMAK